MCSVVLINKLSEDTIDSRIGADKIWDYDTKLKKKFENVEYKIKFNTGLDLIVHPFEKKKNYIICNNNVVVTDKTLKDQTSQSYYIKKYMCTIHFITETISTKELNFYVVLVFDKEIQYVRKYFKPLFTIFN